MGPGPLTKGPDPLSTVAQLLASAEKGPGPFLGLERLDAELLLAAALGRSRAWLIAHGEARIPEAAAREFSDWATRRGDGEPLAYILGTKEFWSLPIRVTRETLIPRPESEVVVEAALTRLPGDFDGEVLDLATGSGCIALAIASERPRARVVASDVSVAALEVAEDNARSLGIVNVCFVQGSWYRPLAGRRFDLITANPPYVAETGPSWAGLSHEPRLALEAGADGLAAHRHVLDGAAEHLRPGAALILEHGFDQREALQLLLGPAGLAYVSSHRDLAGIPRVLVAECPHVA